MQYRIVTGISANERGGELASGIPPGAAAYHHYVYAAHLLTSVLSNLRCFMLISLRFREKICMIMQYYVVIGSV
ncbi:hypothetical protein T05_16058 [Trichinella murrelli]|uniref:Uncharacterized protein n=2 Tax=Trichinella murrelli TaxID=144512 RepID=A0A0V0U2L5_9BILA|nr:hypothetical protein T05_16058 [Trichinella murrelli]